MAAVKGTTAAVGRPTKAKAPKEPKSKKAISASAAPKKPWAHPPYIEMINEAIVALKERTGSSQYAISKFIEEKQKLNLPPNFKKLILVQLKKLVASGKLVKVKNSFKLPAKSPSTDAANKPAAAKVPAKAPAKPKGAAAKPKGTPVKAKVVAKPKAVAKPKDKPAKVAKTKSVTSPGKKVVGPAPRGKKAPVKTMKKPKSIKSPVKKAPTKKANK